jgi:hypothetical protein
MTSPEQVQLRFRWRNVARWALPLRVLRHPIPLLLVQAEMLDDTREIIRPDGFVGTNSR